MKLTRRGIFGVIAAALCIVGASAIGVVVFFPLSPKHEVAMPAKTSEPANSASVARKETSPVLTAADMLKCNRQTIVDESVEPKPKPESPFPKLKDLPIGASGYIKVLESINGKIYGNGTTGVSPEPQKYEEQTYDIHIVKRAQGIAVDCKTPAVIIHSETGEWLQSTWGEFKSYYFPVVSMFSNGKVVGTK